MISRICFLLAGLLAFATLGVVSHAQMPGTFNTMMVAGGLACTPNTQGGGSDANVIGLWHFENNGNDTGARHIPALTLNGTANYSTTQKKFGSYALSIPTNTSAFASFPGTSLLIPANGDVTMEAWQYMPAPLPTYYSWIGDQNATNIFAIGQPTIGVDIGATAATTATVATAFTTGVWQHVAYERQGSTARVFVNGIELPGSPVAGLSTAAIGGTATAWNIGRGYTGSYVMPNNSFLDEVRVSNMVRYTSNFSASLPTLPFCDPASPYVGPGDVASSANAWWGLRSYSKASVQNAQPIVNVRRASDNATCDLMPDFNTGQISYTGNCSTTANNAILSSTFCASACYVAKLYDQSGNKLCTGSVACDASQATSANQPGLTTFCMGNLPCLTYSSGSQTLTTPTGPSVAQPFALSGLASRNGTFTALNTFYVQGTTQTQFRFAAAANTVGTYNGGPSTPTASASDGTVHSLTGAFSGASSSITVDGTKTTGSIETTGSSGVINIGPGTSGNALVGTVGEMGLWPRDLAASNESVSICNNQYSAAYGTACGTVPACTPNTQGGGTDSNVVALYHFDGNLSDSGWRGHNVTTGGSWALQSGAYHLGSGAVGTTGTTAGSLTFPASVDWNIGTADFTVEYWYYNTSPSTTQYVALNDIATGNTFGLDYVNNATYPNQTSAYLTSGGINALFPLTRVGNQWQHFAFVRKGGSMQFYLNGVATGPAQPYAGAVGTSTGALNFGTASSYSYPGMIDELRISNMARYSGNFNPQLSNFCNPVPPAMAGDVQPSARAWWGLRAYNATAITTSAKILNVRRASDNVTCDIVSNPFTGSLGNTASCSNATYNAVSGQNSFCSGTTCYATKVYDQSGNGNDVAQASPSSQPSVNFTCDVGMPCLNFGATAVALNPTDVGNGNNAFSNNNRTVTSAVAGYNSVRGTVGLTTGKWYWEVKVNALPATTPLIGLADNTNAIPASNYCGQFANSMGWRSGTALSASYTGITSDGSPTVSYVANDILMFAIDVDAGKAWIGKNGVWHTNTGGVGNPAAGTNQSMHWTVSAAKSWFPCLTTYEINSSFTLQEGTAIPFSYSAPSGFNGYGTYGQAQTLVSTTSPAGSAPFTVAAWGKRTGAFTTPATLLGQGTTTAIGFGSTANTARFLNGTTTLTSAANDNIPHSTAGTTGGTVFVDTGLSTGTGDTTSTSGTFAINPSSPLTGTFSEAGIWGKSFTSADQASLCGNQFNYAYASVGQGACGVVPVCVPNTQGGGSDADVRGLWHLDNVTLDSSGHGKNAFGYGAAAFSSAQSRFGGYSAYSATTSQWWGTTATAGSGVGPATTGDFTIEGWFYFATAPSSYWTPFGDYSVTTGLIGTLFGGSIPTLNTTYWTSTSGADETWGGWTVNMPVGSWSHLAMVRYQGNNYLYLNGTALTPSTSIGPSTHVALKADYFGLNAGYSSGSYVQVGWVDEVRVSGMARYTGNFTPSQLPFCDPAPAWASGWHTIVGPLTLASSTTGMTNYGTRNSFNASAYNNVTTTTNASQLRVTFSGQVGTTINAAWIGHPATNNAHDLNFDGTQVQLKFSGSNSGTITAGTPLVSDPVLYTFNPGKDLIVSVGWGATSVPLNNTLPANNLYYQSNLSGGSANVGVTASTGWAAPTANYLIGPTTIEGFW
jgi:hypothetical protein